MEVDPQARYNCVQTGGLGLLKLQCTGTVSFLPGMLLLMV